MRYMLMVTATPKYEAGAPVEPALIEAIGKHSRKLIDAGILVQAGGLQPSSKGARIGAKGGKLSVTDGPFTEAKELVGGFAIMELPSKEEAIRLGKEFMQIHVDVLGPDYTGMLEIRPMFDPESHDCPGTQ